MLPALIQCPVAARTMSAQVPSLDLGFHFPMMAGVNTATHRADWVIRTDL